MTLTMATKPRNMFEDPIGLMVDCHRRIERFLYVLITIQRQTHGGILNDDQFQALTCALRYFRDSAPRHMMDEEESLFPKMKIAETEEDLHKLCNEHRTLQDDHSILEILGERWLFDGSLCEGDSLLFGNILARVSRVYQNHIRMEESLIFPAARIALSKAEIETLGKEMADRRF